MHKGRLEAFSDGVIAIIITIMVLALWAPWVAFALYCLVAAIWLVPDRRIERQLIDAG